MIVETKNGKIRGFENESVAGGQKYFSYLGVPYAKPPIGDLRFSAPEPVENWNEIYDATYERDRCSQFDVHLGGGLSGSEDCLHLNIHTTNPNSTFLKPVLFYLHGGGFFCGSGDEAFHGADYLMNHDVVLVTINYRVHMLGFLNLGIPECPGNAGLKDQVIALKWVKENIKAFGGDPNNITINGCSAGGSSVNLLMISPLAKGLFQKAIIQCGTALSVWSLTYDPLKWAYKAGEMLGFKGDDRVELLKFFRALSAEQIATAAAQLLGETTVDYPARGLYCPFSPSVEVIQDGAFLPDHPRNLAKTTTPVPCIAGHNQVERVYFGRYIAENISNASESMIKEIIRSNFDVNDSQLSSIDEELRKFYFHQNDRSKSNTEKIDQLLTDICCLHFYDALEFVLKSNMPLYVFHFIYYTENPFRKVLSQLYPLSKNAFHGEEQRFVLASKLFGREPFLKSEDINVQKNMCQLWTNFMKTGYPGGEGVDVQWKPHTTEDPCYLEMDAEFKMRDGLIDEKTFKFLYNILRDIELRK